MYGKSYSHISIVSPYHISHGSLFDLSQASSPTTTKGQQLIRAVAESAPGINQNRGPKDVRNAQNHVFLTAGNYQGSAGAIWPKHKTDTRHYRPKP